MDHFTFEAGNRSSELETYEWDHVWWEQADDQTRPRVLYIGDSISCGIRRIATQLTDEKILFDGVGTSKAVDNPYFKDLIHLFGKQQRTRKIVLFNNGLHGFHLNDTEQYRTYYMDLVEFLMEEFGESTLALVLTTGVTGLHRERVITRNAVVKEIAQTYHLPIIDLYSISENDARLRSEDGVHYTAEGKEKLAEKLLESLYKMIPEITHE